VDLGFELVVLRDFFVLQRALEVVHGEFGVECYFAVDRAVFGRQLSLDAQA